MADYAYMTATNKIKVFLDKIQEVGVPPKATQGWLAGIGFTSTNDRALIPILRQIGFVDGTGTPTRRWEEFRGGDRRVLGGAIQQGYAAFYSTYPDAHSRSTAELENIVKSTAPKLGKDAVSRVIATYRVLVSAADFGENGSAPAAPPETGPNGATPAAEPQPATLVRGLGGGFTINVNVQLTLPETTDGAVYEKLFAAMREHLLEGLANGS